MKIVKYSALEVKFINIPTCNLKKYLYYFKFLIILLSLVDIE